MASLTRPFVTHFADHLTEGDVFSVYRDGTQTVRITAPPVRIKNLVGERSYVIVQVARTSDTRITGQMVLAPASVVYVRT